MIEKAWRPNSYVDKLPEVKPSAKPLLDPGVIPEWVDYTLAAVTFLAAILVIVGVLLWPIITHPAVSQ